MQLSDTVSTARTGLDRATAEAVATKAVEGAIVDNANGASVARASSDTFRRSRQAAVEMLALDPSTGDQDLDAITAVAPQDGWIGQAAAAALMPLSKRRAFQTNISGWHSA